MLGGDPLKEGQVLQGLGPGSPVQYSLGTDIIGLHWYHWPPVQWHRRRQVQWPVIQLTHTFLSRASGAGAHRHIS